MAGEVENLQEQMDEIWPSTPLDPCKISWLGIQLERFRRSGVEPEPALAYMAYGNQGETAVEYSHAVMLGVVPGFAERELERQRRDVHGEGGDPCGFLGKRSSQAVWGSIEKDENCVCPKEWWEEEIETGSDDCDRDGDVGMGRDGYHEDDGSDDEPIYWSGGQALL